MKIDNKPVKLIIAGGRDFNDYTHLKNSVDNLIKDLGYPEVEIISGMARGADKLGERYALEHGYTVIYKAAQWDIYGKSAGYRRNVEMANVATHVIVFWDKKSKGTKHMLDIAIDKELPLTVVYYV